MERNSFNLNTVVPAVLIASLLTGSIWLKPDREYKSTRPAGKDDLELTVIGDQVVDSRLWEDPFRAVEQYRRINNTPGKRIELDFFSELGNQIARRLEKKEQIKLFLPMVSGAPYAEDAENRIRLRYALLSALATAGFEPDDASHVGYIEMPWARGAELFGYKDAVAPLLLTGGGKNEHIVVPFEWFSKRDSRENSTILVLWINELAFDDFPFFRLGQFISQFQSKVYKGKTFREFETVVFPTMVGKFLQDPWKSRLFEIDAGPDPRLIAEGVTNLTTPQAVLKGAKFYSAWSTAADCIWTKDAPSPGRSATVGRFATNGIAFYNATTTDEQLVGSIIDELTLRKVDLTKRARFGDRQYHGTVVLLSEWDTTYGRALPNTFAAELLRRRFNNSGALSSYMTQVEEKTAWPTNVYSFTYLRGVDTRLVKDTSETAGQITRDTKEPRITKLPELEKPEGNRQLDYIRRLAARLQQFEKVLKRRGDGQIVAIGILGSDVYDKLLLLQSLRLQFPQAIFFTTDLDARLLEPAQLSWTRNLLVASSYGLQLANELQSSTPPFRDSYQTALFAAAEAALGKCPPSSFEALEPRMFEVSQMGAYDLSVKPHPMNPSRSAALLGPRQPFWYLLGIAAQILLIFALVVILFSKFSSTAHHSVNFCKCIWSSREDFPSALDIFSHRTVRWCSVALSGFLIVVLSFILFDHFRPNGEPFSWFLGISVWPTELIRLCAAYGGLFLLFRARAQLRQNKRELSREFNLPDPEPGIPVLRNLSDIDLSTWQPPKKTVGGADKLDALALWKEYNRLGHFKFRMLRISLPVILFLGAGLLLMVLFGFPFRPVRGEISNVLDYLLLGLSVIVHIVLTFFVVDATRLCRKLIRNLIAAPTEWPLETLTAESAALGVPQESLEEYLDVRVIAERTKVVSGLIFYPFLTLSLLIVSRARFFDRWDWPIGLIIVMGAVCLYAIYAVLSLRRAAEDARAITLAHLERRLLQKEGLTIPEAKAHSEQLKLLILSVQRCEDGAFAPLPKHPVVGAILMPFGGASALSLIDYLIKL